MPLTTQQIEAQRVKFEAQDWSKYDIYFELDNLGAYIDFHAEIAFKAWLSAIESVEIELPKPYTEFDAMDEPHNWFGVSQIVNTIKSQGYKVKL